MRPLILHYYYGVIDGVFASIIDMYYNLSRFIDIDLWIYTDKPQQCIQHLFKNNTGDLVNKITTKTEFKNDIIRMDERYSNNSEDLSVKLIIDRFSFSVMKIFNTVEVKS